MPKYRIDQTEAATDGSGNVAFDVWALDDNDNVIPGKHVTVLCPHEEVDEVIAQPTNAQKLAALKAMLLKNRPADGWDNDELSRYVAANINAADADADFDELIDGVGGYPLSFSL